MSVKRTLEGGKREKLGRFVRILTVEMSVISGLFVDRRSVEVKGVTRAVYRSRNVEFDF